MVLNRTHPVLADLSASQARAAADGLRGAPLAAAVLRLHADRVDLAGREDRLLARFTKAHGAVPVTRVPVVPSVGDLDGLREIGHHLAAATTHPRPFQHGELSPAFPAYCRAARPMLPTAAAAMPPDAPVIAGSARFPARCGRSRTNRRSRLAARAACGGAGSMVAAPRAGRPTARRSLGPPGQAPPLPSPVALTAAARRWPATSTQRLQHGDQQPHDRAAAHAVRWSWGSARSTSMASCAARASAKSSAHDSDVGPPPQQRAPLPLRHPAPDPELDPLVERVRETFGAYRADAAEAARLPLLASCDEQVLGVGRATTRRTTPVPS